MTSTITPTFTITATPTPTPTGRGPLVLVLTILNNVDGCTGCCSQNCVLTPTPTPEIDAEGRQVFSVGSGQFLIVVEGGIGASGAFPGAALMAGDSGRPDLWIENNRPLGNGSAQVCDTGPVAGGGGGVPGIDPPEFDENNAAVTNALRDFACRFDPGISASSPCTILDPTREPKVINPASRVQFCSYLSATEALPPGESILSVVLRDVQGNVGPLRQAVVRVATVTETPTRTATPTITQTRTVSGTRTITITPTRTSTASVTATPSITQTFTPSLTRTVTATRTGTPSRTATPSHSPSPVG